MLITTVPSFSPRLERRAASAQPQGGFQVACSKLLVQAHSIFKLSFRLPSRPVAPVLEKRRSDRVELQLHRTLGAALGVLKHRDQQQGHRRHRAGQGTLCCACKADDQSNDPSYDDQHADREEDPAARKVGRNLGNGIESPAALASLGRMSQQPPIPARSTARVFRSHCRIVIDGAAVGAGIAARASPARNLLGAHVDSRHSMLAIQEHLLYLDYRGVTRLARRVLDRLDVIGAGRLDLELLLIGERRIDSWPTDPSKSARGRPDRTTLTGTLSGFFRRLDSRYMVVSTSSFGSAVLMGITAARKPEPRPVISIRTRRPDCYTEPLAPRLWQSRA